MGGPYNQFPSIYTGGGGEPYNQFPSIYTGGEWRGEGNPSIPLHIYGRGRGPSIYTGGGGEPLHIINSPPYIREGNGGGRGTPPFMGGEWRGRII